MLFGGIFCYYCLPLYHSLLFRVFLLPLYTIYVVVFLQHMYICTLNVGLFCLSMYNMPGILLQLTHRRSIMLLFLYACTYTHYYICICIYFSVEHNTNIIIWCTLLAIGIKIYNNIFILPQHKQINY